MIIDCHGHYTTAPAALQTFRDAQLAALRRAQAAHRPRTPRISDDQIRDSLEKAQLKLQRERGTRPDHLLAARLGHGPSPRRCGRQPALEPHLQRPDPSRLQSLPAQLRRRLPVAAVAGGARRPTAPPNSSAACSELGFIGCNLNPDPSGGHWNSPPLTDRHWYPLYEKMVELDVPAMVHVSASCNPNFHATGAHYLNADTTAFMQFLTSDLFKDFPTLRFIIPHGGGAVPYHWGRYRGLAQDLKRPPLEELLLQNVFFDTCVYHLPGIELLFKVVPLDNILFGSEMVGAVRGIDPRSGHHYDDTKRYIDALALSGADRERLFSGNARRVYPGLTARLATAG